MAGDNRKPIVELGDYQGKPSITLKWRADSQYPFSFGVTKAQLILACIDEIKAFVAAHPDQGGGGRNNRPQGPRRQDAPLHDRHDAPLQQRPGSGGAGVAGGLPGVTALSSRPGSEGGPPPC